MKKLFQITLKSEFDHYGDAKQISSTIHKTINAGLRIKYVFGYSSSKIVADKEQKVYYDDFKSKAKDLSIIVKDNRQTNLGLNGVTVSIEGTGVLKNILTISIKVSFAQMQH